MTTIAYRDGVLAADRRRTAYGYRMPPEVKLRIRGEWVLAGSGDAVVTERLIREFDPEADEFGVADMTEDTTLVAARTGELMMFQKGGSASLDPTVFHAWGSGVGPALAAMHCGCNAVRAVEVASLVCPYTGDGVDSQRLQEVFARDARRRRQERGRTGVSDWVHTHRVAVCVA